MGQARRQRRALRATTASSRNGFALGPAAGWDDFEAAHIHAADEIYRDGIVAQDTWDALAERYDTREMMSVVMTVANYRLVSMSLNALGVQPQATDELFPDVAVP